MQRFNKVMATSRVLCSILTKCTTMAALAEFNDSGSNRATKVVFLLGLLTTWYVPARRASVNLSVNLQKNFLKNTHSHVFKRYAIFMVKVPNIRYKAYVNIKVDTDEVCVCVRKLWYKWISNRQTEMTKYKTYFSNAFLQVHTR